MLLMCMFWRNIGGKRCWFKAFLITKQLLPQVVGTDSARAESVGDVGRSLVMQLALIVQTLLHRAVKILGLGLGKLGLSPDLLRQSLDDELVSCIAYSKKREGH